MCGIFSLLNHDFVSDSFIEQQFELGKNRGPEFSKLIDLPKMKMGFHRLAINGLDEKSNQPFCYNKIYLVCNGEIYNYKVLYKMLNISPTTNSDCEIIIHLYLKYGIEQTLLLLDGVFSFILYDGRLDEINKYPQVFVARDPYGVRPLYILSNTGLKSCNYELIGFASELKCLSKFHIEHQYSISQFQPGTYSQFNLYKNNDHMEWVNFKQNVTYFTPVFSPVLYSNYNNSDVDEYSNLIRKSLMDAVEKRCNTTDRPIACLLSGGLDSSLIAALVKHFNTKNGNEELETYSIGLAESEDLKYARIVADYLGTKHTEIVVTEQEMIDAIPDVICSIESYDTTTVRASIGNYLLGKYISQFSNAKVIFNGDGSDEIAGGYLYMSKCPDCFEFDKETRRLLKDIHLFDVLRSDKSISSHGLEPRTPFLDKNFVNAYLSIPANIRFDTNTNFCEKYLIRYAFSNLHPDSSTQEKQFLPDCILWRKKEAFSDGVSGQNKSLYQIIQSYIDDNIKIENNESNIKSIDKEKLYYKSLFNMYYPNSSNVLPYYWMPKYINSNDPSARTLKIYSLK